MSKKINRAMLQDILKRGDGVKTVSGEAVDWVIAVAEEAAKNLAASGKRSPSGRLMAPKMLPMDYARLEARVFAAPTLQVTSSPASMPEKPETIRAEEWSEYHDWQTEVRQGKTKLKFPEWKKAKT